MICLVNTRYEKRVNTGDRRPGRKSFSCAHRPLGGEVSRDRSFGNRCQRRSIRRTLSSRHDWPPYVEPTPDRSQTKFSD